MSTTIATWIASTNPNVHPLTSANRPTTDVDGGPLGIDPMLPPGDAVTSPLAFSDPAIAAVGGYGAPYGKWGGNTTPTPVTLTYSFYETGGPPIAGGACTPMPLDSAHRDAVRSALASFAEIASLTFVEIAESSSGGPTGIPGASGAIVGHLRFIDDIDLNLDPTMAGWTQQPGSTVASSGVVALDVNRFGLTDNLARGARPYSIIVHELGHALGLSHPFDSEDSKAAAGDPRAVNGAWHTGWTIMSYTTPGSNLLPAGQTNFAIGPQVADVYALQGWYGANRLTRTGDDVYAIDGRPPLAALWDAGGTDTLDASAAILAGGTTGLVLDLTPGHIGPHIAIAFGAAIENTIGSVGNDTIIGTNLGALAAGDGISTVMDGNNVLDGGPGNDTILGRGGDDVLIGGSGTNLLDGGDGDDIAFFASASASATVIHDGTNIVVTTATASDRLRSVETLVFTDRILSVGNAVSLLAPPSTLSANSSARPATPNPQLQPPPAIDPARKLAIWSGGVSRELAIDDYVGPVMTLRYMHLGDASSEAMHGTDSNDFLHGMGGHDAIDGGMGDDVIDGGIDSNFLTGGAGTDTFFVDGRSEGVTWSTVTDLEKGEWVTAWGWKQGTSKLTWEEMSGAEGYKGATARIDLDGNGSVDMSMTLAGKTAGQIIVSPGQVGDSAYIAFTLV